MCCCDDILADLLTDWISELIKKEVIKGKVALKVDICSYGEELLEVADRSEIDMFILTLNNIKFRSVLPVQDPFQNSLQLINQIKTKYGKPVIVLSDPLEGFSSIIERARMSTDFFFLLPFEADPFLEAVERGLRMSLGFDKLP